MFGDFTWRVRSEIPVVRRAIATLAGGSAALRELAVAWIEAERARGIGIGTLARRWSSLASLVTAIGKHSPRPRGTSPPALGRIPRETTDEITARGVAEIVSRCCAAGRYSDAAIVGVIGETGARDEAVASLRVAALARLVATTGTRRAIAEVCRGKPASAWAFGGQRRGQPLSPRGVRQACERNGTTAAALRRVAQGGRP